MGSPRVPPRKAGYGLVIILTAAALALLFTFHLFYLQLILVVGSAAVMAGIVIWERRTGDGGSGPQEKGDGMVRLARELDAIRLRLQASGDEQEKGSLRSRMVQLEHEVRRLQWAQKEARFEGLSGERSASLPPLDTGADPAARRWKEKDEARHLNDLLAGAIKVLASEPPPSAREHLGMMAHDLKAHHGLIRKSSPDSQSLRDYFASWAVLTSIRNGNLPERRLKVYASREVRSKLDELTGMAVSRDIVRAPALG